ncbi:energy transducer TonB [Rasiella sp. SM2506]|uniref:energy transducer TonB n=1 Tax=Rasiella sp. SM2506 TaxID=3423914 RepID=UPI003D78EC68
MGWKIFFLLLSVVTISTAQEEVISFSQVDTPPRYRDCSAGTVQQEILCTQESVEAFAKQKFNTGLFKNLNLNERRIRVYAQFIIDENGGIKDIKIRTPHPQLQKETNRVLELLPNFIPGRHDKYPVKTKYTLPLVFVLG